MIHSGTAQINRANALGNHINENSSNNTNTATNINSSISKFIDGNSTSPLEGLLFSIQGISYICFTLVLILTIQLFIRLYLKEDINITILGTNLNYYLNKLIKFNKKVSIVYIWLILIILLISLAYIGYFSSELYNNIDKYINIHNFVKNK